MKRSFRRVAALANGEPTARGLSRRRRGGQRVEAGERLGVAVGVDHSPRAEAVGQTQCMNAARAPLCGRTELVQRTSARRVGWRRRRRRA
jgi:hypothetical protein